MEQTVLGVESQERLRAVGWIRETEIRDEVLLQHLPQAVEADFKAVDDRFGNALGIESGATGWRIPVVVVLLSKPRDSRNLE